MKKNIVLLYTCEARERLILEIIKGELVKKNSNINVSIMGIEEFPVYLLDSRVDVVLSPPIKDDILASIMTFCKVLHNCKVVCLVTEGVEDFDDISVVDDRLGQCQFSNKLIDYFFYWGEKTAMIYGNRMLEKGLIMSMEQIGVSGYVMYDFETVSNSIKDKGVKREASSFAKQYKKNILFVTGFCFDDDPVEAAKGYGSFPKYDSQEEYENIVSIIRRNHDMAIKYAYNYLDLICYIAQKLPEVGIIVKLHPTETGNVSKYLEKSYQNLKEYKNVMLVENPLPIFMLFDLVEMMFHYGSTTSLEAYIKKLPTVLLTKCSFDTSKHIYGESNGIISTNQIAVDEKQKVIELINTGLKYKYSKINDIFLKNNFNYEQEIIYSPAKIIANELNNDSSIFRMNKKDSDVLRTHQFERAFHAKYAYYREVLRSIKQVKVTRATKILVELCKIQPHIGYFIADIFKFVRWKMGMCRKDRIGK